MPCVWFLSGFVPIVKGIVFAKAGLFCTATIRCVVVWLKTPRWINAFSQNPAVRRVFRNIAASSKKFATASKTVGALRLESHHCSHHQDLDENPAALLLTTTETGISRLLAKNLAWTNRHVLDPRVPMQHVSKVFSHSTGAAASFKRTSPH